MPVSYTHLDVYKRQALDYLSRYVAEGETFINKTVTGDETQMSHRNAETKQQSIVWGHTALPNKPKKAWKTLSARKVLTTVFWDVKGILLVEFMKHGATINSEVYFETL